MALYTANSAADLVGYVNGTGGYPRATNGDTIAIVAGSFALAADLLPQAGVTIEGAGLATTTLTGSATAGRWEADLAGSGAKLVVRRLTIDATAMQGRTFGAATSIVNLANGTFELEDVRITKGLSGNGLTWITSTHPCVAKMSRCRVDFSFDDCISTKAPGGAGLAAASLLTLFGCEADHSGPDAIDQCLTAHDGFAMVDWYGNYHDANLNAVAPDAATTQITLIGTRVRGGIVFPYKLFGVDFQGPGPLTVLHSCRFSQIVCTTDSDALASGANGVVFEGNRVSNSTTVNTGLAAINVNHSDCSVLSNRATSYTVNLRSGIRVSSGAAGTIRILNNYSLGNNRGYLISAAAGANVIFKNNTAASNTFDVVYATGILTKGYGVFPGAFSGYTADATDTLAAPALDAREVPTTGGNCDGTGDASVYAFSGGLDLLRRSRLLSPSRVGRGPMENQRWVSGRKLNAAGQLLAAS